MSPLVQTPRSNDGAVRECLQRYANMEKDPIYESLCRCSIREKSLHWDEVQNHSWRRWWFWRPKFSLQRIHTSTRRSKFQDPCNDQRKTTIGPVLQVHITRYLDIIGIEILILSTTGNDLKSWVVICRGTNRHVEELRLNDPDHNPASSELVNHKRMERPVAMKREPCSRKMEVPWSSEETHEKQLKI